jgi:hypothetical protein
VQDIRGEALERQVPTADATYPEERTDDRVRRRRKGKDAREGVFGGERQLARLDLVDLVLLEVAVEHGHPPTLPAKQ